VRVVEAVSGRVAACSSWLGYSEKSAPERRRSAGPWQAATPRAARTWLHYVRQLTLRLPDQSSVFAPVAWNPLERAMSHSGMLGRRAAASIGRLRPAPCRGRKVHTPVLPSARHRR
jgi:hypothetical protein